VVFLIEGHVEKINLKGLETLAFENIKIKLNSG